MIIAADTGSSFLKLALLDMENRSAVRRRQYPQRRIQGTPDCAYEYDAQEMCGRIRGYIASQRQDRAIDGIILATQMHGFVLRNIKTGSFTNYISWQDERSLCGTEDGSSYLRDISLKVPGDIMRDSGVGIKSELALSGAYTFFSQNGIRDCGDWELFTLGSYIIWHLTGKNVTHSTNAAATGLYRPAAGDWNLSLLRALGMEGLKLPAVCDGIEAVGEYEGIPVYPDIGDHQASVYGCLAGRDALCVNIGTASQLSLVRDVFDAGYYGGIHEVRPYFGGRYVDTISKLPGGRSVEVIVRFLSQCASLSPGGGCGEADIWRMLDGFVPGEPPTLSVGTGFFRTLHFNEGYIKNIDADNFTPHNLISGMFYSMADTFGRLSGSLGWTGETVASGRFSGIIAACMKRLGYGPEITASEKEQPLFEGLISLLEGRI